MVHHFSILIKLETQLDRNYWGNDNLLIRNIFVHLKNLRKVEEKKEKSERINKSGSVRFTGTSNPGPVRGGVQQVNKDVAEVSKWRLATRNDLVNIKNQLHHRYK